MTAIEDNARSIFLEALERGADQWPAFLDAACGGDAELRARVDQLLHAHQAMGSIHADSGGAVTAATLDQPVTLGLQEGPGSRVGPYRLLEPIGEGGMGVVFLAEQQRPVRRQVAVKVIKAGMDTRQVVARFEAERQALALMDHPNIAKVLDAGATDSGRPYFVMELVRGVPITRYCDDHRLTPRDRLGLFVQVCQAVQHAHQKGIIHRDLKPSNVLVALYDGRPVPKVIDFGVAKATGGRLTEATLFTGFGALVGTPEYMSPEQAEINQADIDTRSDVYSLGVVLYELLTGSTPLLRKQLNAAALVEVLRVVREQDPPKPSTRLGTTDQLASIAASRGLEPRKLGVAVRGELDWIVMKALEKDRNRRYETANGFAMDLQRYLADEPVQACPPSVGYRLRKFARRNKAILATTAVLFVMLLAAVGAVAGAIGWAARNRAALEQQVAQDRTTRRAILKTEVGRALDDAAASYQRDKLSESLAHVRRAEGLLAGGEVDAALAERVSRWREAMMFAQRLEEAPFERIVPKEEAIDWAASESAYRKAFHDFGLDLPTLTPEAMADRIRSSVIRDRLIAALDDWWLCKTAAKSEGKEKLLEAVRRSDEDPLRAAFRAAFQRRDGGELARLAADPETAAQQPATVRLLASMLHSVGQAPGAVRLLEEAQQRHAGDFWINYILASALMRSDPPRDADAVAFFRVAASLRPDNGMVHYSLGYALQSDNKLARAEAAFRQAERFWPHSAVIQTNRGIMFSGQRRWDDARSALELAVRLNPDKAWAQSNLAWIYGNCPDPRFLDYSRALEHARKARDLEPNFRLRRNHLGAIQYRAGMVQQALETLQEAERMEGTPDNYHRVYLVLANCRLGHEHEALKHWVQFVPWMDAAAASLRRDNPLHYEELCSLRAEAEGLLGRLHDRDAACVEILRIEPGCAAAQYGLADCFLRSRQWTKAAEAYFTAANLEDPPDMATWLAAACAMVWAENTEAYLKLCDRMAKRLGQSRDLNQTAFFAHVCVLAPGALADRDRVVQLAEQRMDLTSEIEVHRLWSMHVLGLAYFRSGQFEKAVAGLEAAQKDPGFQTPSFKMSNWLVLAMSRHRLGQGPEAVAALQSARAILAEERSEVDRQDLSVQILFREAESLLGKQ